MSTWDKVALRFIASVIALIVLGYGIKFAYHTHTAYEDMQPNAAKDRMNAIEGK